MGRKPRENPCRVCGGAIPTGSARRWYCSAKCGEIAKKYQSAVAAYRGRKSQTPPTWDEWMERHGITTSPVHEIESVRVMPLTRINGRLLKELRRSKRLTQKEVADRLGVSCSAYRLYEIGQLKDEEKIERVAYFFDVPVEQLLQKDRPAGIMAMHDIAKDIEAGSVSFGGRTYNLGKEDRKKLKEILTVFFRKFGR